MKWPSSQTATSLHVKFGDCKKSQVMSLKGIVMIWACAVSFGNNTKNVDLRIPRLCTWLWKAVWKTMR